jgi:hypothetical protein
LSPASTSLRPSKIKDVLAVAAMLLALSAITPVRRRADGRAKLAEAGQAEA